MSECVVVYAKTEALRFAKSVSASVLYNCVLVLRTLKMCEYRRLDSASARQAERLSAEARARGALCKWCRRVERARVF